MTRPSASDLPRAFRCPGSLVLPQARTSSPEAEAGTARHAEQQDALDAGSYDAMPAKVRALIPADATSVRAEVAVAYDLATGRGRELGVGIGRTYPALGASEIAGTADLVAIAPGRVVVVDYKGASDVGAPEQNEQLLFYALALARAHDADEVTLAIAYLATGHVTPPVTVDTLELEAFAQRLVRLQRDIDTQSIRVFSGRMPDVAEGKHCTWCPAAHACPARTALLRRLVSGEERDDLELLRPLDGATARAAYERLQAGKGLLKRIEQALYKYAGEQPIDLGGGRWFGKHTKRSNEEISGDIAHAVLEQMHGRAVADAAVERVATKAGIARALKECVPRGAVSAAERAVLAAIRDNGGARRETKETVGEFSARDLLAGGDE
jgi:hypothetical protein